jgi:hypothetical protein
LKSFYKTFAILVGIIFWILLSLQLFKPEWMAIYSWLLFLYFIGLTLLSYYLIEKGVKTKDALDFYNASMGSTTLRLFISGGVLFYYFFNYQEQQVHFTITFFSLYVCFTVFEIVTLLKKIK